MGDDLGTILGAFNLFPKRTRWNRRRNPGGGAAIADVATIGLLQQRELDRAHTVEGLPQQTRIGIEPAKGIVSERMGIEVDAAFALLRSHAATTTPSSTTSPRRSSEAYSLRAI